MRFSVEESNRNNPSLKRPLGASPISFPKSPPDSDEAWTLCEFFAYRFFSVSYGKSLVLVKLGPSQLFEARARRWNANVR